MQRENIASFFYLKIFIVFVVLIIIGSIGIRVGSELNNSSFKNNSYSTLFVGKDSKIVTVDRNAETATLIAIGDIRKLVEGKSPFAVSIALGIPVSCMVIATEFPFRNFEEFNSYKNELSLVLSQKIYKNCNRYDMHKLVNESKNTPEDNRKAIRLNIFNLKRGELDNVFKDSLITNMDYSIEIDNGTTINGLGNLLALILTRVGFNVIEVRTVNKRDESFIAIPQNRDSYINTLVGLTGLPIKHVQVSKAADLTIHLGEDLDIMLDQ